MYIHRYTPELALTLLPAPRLATAGLRRGLIHPLSPTAGLKLSVSKRRQTDRSSSSISKAEAAFCTFKNVTSDQQESFFFSSSEKTQFNNTTFHCKQSAFWLLTRHPHAVQTLYVLVQTRPFQFTKEITFKI